MQSQLYISVKHVGVKILPIFCSLNANFYYIRENKHAAKSAKISKPFK